jgi:MbtH protein
MEGKVANPFEDENGVYHVLINDEGQHSLWPTFIEVPDGWKVIHKSDTRAACLEFINKNWTDMRPNSLIESMKAISAGDQQNAPQGEPSDGALTPDTKTIH